MWLGEFVLFDLFSVCTGLNLAVLVFCGFEFVLVCVVFGTSG